MEKIAVMSRRPDDDKDETIMASGVDLLGNPASVREKILKFDSSKFRFCESHTTICVKVYTLEIIEYLNSGSSQYTV